MPNSARRATVEAAATSAAAEPSGPQIAAAAATFALLSSPPRLHLVWLITHGAYDVGTLADRAGISIATASQHLAKLRLAGVVTAHREGRRHLYTVDDPHIVKLVEEIFDHIAPDGTLAPDPPH
ncbi:transcriptional regulator [Amycolatopsis deserti]|uniref:Transcriptional regulator n=1 Tax=Amycolatopsis deserti TaxID=185696 RepID=A0ABQ3ID05_9PSEU|nr:metalloregulator ArsR/SmtB family transcription factor [Amycolatopsis deserti]GHE75891.1 transcriptional regulator [Amycolatopsis deserti]